MSDGLKNILKRIEKLEKAVFSSSIQKPATSKTEVDFTLNERNFVKTYAKNMSGAKKFTLIVAYLSKGKAGESVDADKIILLWNRMKSNDLLGYSFNSKYPTAAKTSGWVDSKKRGSYFLRNNWREIFS